jgi:hypothetical protein
MISVLVLLYLLDGFHVDFSISLGNIMVVVSIMTMTWVLNRKLTIFMLEHEVFAHDYAYRAGIKRSEILVHSRISRTNGHANGAAVGKGG